MGRCRQPGVDGEMDGEMQAGRQADRRWRGICDKGGLWGPRRMKPGRSTSPFREITTMEPGSKLVSRPDWEPEPHQTPISQSESGPEKTPTAQPASKAPLLLTPLGPVSRAAGLPRPLAVLSAHQEVKLLCPGHVCSIQRVGVQLRCSWAWPRPEPNGDQVGLCRMSYWV